jgi:hypothetical protein
MPQHSKHSASTRSLGLDPLRDEVYRQMFRVESGRPQAELHLARAVLRAWSALELLPVDDERRKWLRKICPICVRMIDSVLVTGLTNGNDLQAGECGSKRSARRKGEKHGS